MADPKTILVVEDEEQLALAIKIRLQTAGYRVLTVGNGREALEVVEREHLDVIVLDFLLPIMDGYACLRELNARLGRGRIPVIILTARDRMKDLFELEGVEDYIVKPFNHEDLLTRIRRVLQRPEASAS